MGRDNPLILVRRALENISSATFVGQQTDATEVVDVVEFSWNANVRMRLHLDAGDHRLSSDGEKLDLKGSEGRVLRVYKLADCPHAKDMLVAYAPQGRLVVQADLLVELAPYSPTTAAFAAWIAGPSASKIDWIIGTHQAKVSRAEFEAAGRARKQD